MAQEHQGSNLNSKGSRAAPDQSHFWQEPECPSTDWPVWKYYNVLAQTS